MKWSCISTELLRFFAEFRITPRSRQSLRHPDTGGFLWNTDAHGSKGYTRICAGPARHSGLWLRGRRGDAYESVHGRPRNPRGMATRARSAQAGMPGCEEKCSLAFHPCASMCIRGFKSLLEFLVPTLGFTQIREELLLPSGCFVSLWAFILPARGDAQLRKGLRPLACPGIPGEPRGKARSR